MMQEAQNPLILRCHRLVDAFTKSDDERDFYLDRCEGFIVYVDLDKSEAELNALEQEIAKNMSRYCLIPKLTFYESKKIMEGFVNEKVYDIDTKEKLLDIIQSKEARENFLEFIQDHHAEQEKWQQYYQERSRIRIIEWLRNNQFTFVFEEDLELPKELIEKLKMNLFQSKVGKDLLVARKALASRAKAYYSNEALNPRPKRGRPPKQIAKQEFEPKVTMDIYSTVLPAVRPFLFTPDFASPSAVTFSSRFENERELMMSRRLNTLNEAEANSDNLNQKLAALRGLSARWVEDGSSKKTESTPQLDHLIRDEENEEDGEENSMSINLLDPFHKLLAPTAPVKSTAKKKTTAKKATAKKPAAKKAAPKKAATKPKAATTAKKKPAAKTAAKKPAAKKTTTKKAAPRAKAAVKTTAKKAVAKTAAKVTAKRKTLSHSKAKKPTARKATARRKMQHKAKAGSAHARR